MSVRVTIDSDSGFCFGVTTAINKAEEELARGGTLYCLGDIVHNSEEVDRLHARGLNTITHDDLRRLRDARVLLRAHGEPPATYAIARANGIDIIDATCPVVLQLQRRVKQTYDSEGPDVQIVIYGKQGHAEVNGLVGQTDGNAIVVEDISALGQLDYSRPVYLYSQTTMSLDGFEAMKMEIERRLNPGVTFRSFDTICRRVANRIGGLREFARSHQLVLFVSGAKSSNGRILYNECLRVNPGSKMVSSADDLRPGWFDGIDSVGICGATSTPRWLMEKVRDKVLTITQS